MRELIQKELKTIEKAHDVRIIYACESGSRAWGFPSSDSDYDVRFIYMHPPDWYLTVTERDDVLERPPNKEIDISGWDVRKALQLLRRSNPPLLEWLSSPVVYRSDDSAIAPFITLSRKSFLPETACHHYLSMARNSVAKFGDAEEARVKHYLYALRTALCAAWVAARREQPPVLIQELLQEFLPHGAMREYVDQLILRKSGETEKALVKRSSDFEAYLHAQIEKAFSCIPKNAGTLPIELCDRTFRQILNTPQ